MPKFRKKPVEIEAFQVPARGAEPSQEFLDFIEKSDREITSGRDEGLEIETLEGVMYAAPGDWIIRGIQGEYYPCKPDIFAATYEEVQS